MHWMLEENMYRERGLDDMVRVLDRAGLPHSTHKIVPFIHTIIPEPPVIDGPIVVFGTYGLALTAVERGWSPGAWLGHNFEFPVWRHHWSNECLNADAETCRFDNVPDMEEFFMRPAADSKTFAGDVFTWEEWQEWKHRVVSLGEDDGSTLTGATLVVVGVPKTILRECRLWVVDGRVVTSSMYKFGQIKRYDANVDPDIVQYGEKIAAIWSPARAFVLDVALCPNNQLKIIEINCLNAAGLYAADVGKLVAAIEDMGY